MLQKKKIPNSGKFNKHTKEMEPTTKTPSLERIKLRARRITAMQELLACLNTTKSKTSRWREEVKNKPGTLLRNSSGVLTWAMPKKKKLSRLNK